MGGRSAATSDINPSNVADIVGEYAQASADQVQLAISAARQAFADWSFGSIQQRADILDAIGGEILARREELGTLLSRKGSSYGPREQGRYAREFYTVVKTVYVNPGEFKPGARRTVGA
jgi:hypothetical protein